MYKILGNIMSRVQAGYKQVPTRLNNVCSAIQCSTTMRQRTLKFYIQIENITLKDDMQLSLILSLVIYMKAIFAQ